MLILLVQLVGMVGTLVLMVAGVTYIEVTLADLADHRPPLLRIVAGIICGYIAGMLFIWTLVPRDWTLPFWTTVAASLNAAKYGHPVEHAAEGIVIWMMFGGVVGSVVGGSVAQFAGKFLRGRGVVQAH